MKNNPSNEKPQAPKRSAVADKIRQFENMGEQHSERPTPEAPKHAQQTPKPNASYVPSFPRGGVPNRNANYMNASLPPHANVSPQRAQYVNIPSALNADATKPSGNAQGSPYANIPSQVDVPPPTVRIETPRDASRRYDPNDTRANDSTTVQLPNDGYRAAGKFVGKSGSAWIQKLNDGKLVHYPEQGLSDNAKKLAEESAIFGNSLEVTTADGKLQVERVQTREQAPVFHVRKRSPF